MRIRTIVLTVATTIVTAGCFVCPPAGVRWETPAPESKTCTQEFGSTASVVGIAGMRLTYPDGTPIVCSIPIA